MSDCTAFIKAECVFVHITNQLFPVSAGILFTFSFLYLHAASIHLSESGVVQTAVYSTDCVANKSNCMSTHAITSFWNQETATQSPRNKISFPWEGGLLSHYALQPSLKRPTEPFSLAANIPSVYWSAARCHTAALPLQDRKCWRGLNKRCLELEWQLLLEERAGMCVWTCSLVAPDPHGWCLWQRLWSCEGVSAQPCEEASRVLWIYDTQTKNILDNETN